MKKNPKIFISLIFILLFICMFSTVYASVEKPTERTVVTNFIGLTANTLKQGERIIGFGNSLYGVFPYWYGLTDKITIIIDPIMLAVSGYIKANVSLIKNGKLLLSLWGSRSGLIDSSDTEAIDLSNFGFEIGFNSSVKLKNNLWIHYSIDYTPAFYYPSEIVIGEEYKEEYGIDNRIGFHYLFKNSILLKSGTAITLLPEFEFYGSSLDVEVSLSNTCVLNMGVVLLRDENKTSNLGVGPIIGLFWRFDNVKNK